MEYRPAHPTDSKTKAQGLPPRSQAAPAGSVLSPSSSHCRLATQLSDLDTPVASLGLGVSIATCHHQLNQQAHQWLGGLGVTGPWAGSLLGVAGPCSTL